MFENDIFNQILDIMEKKLKEVTKTNPCPHCGKPDWCYSLGDLTVCNRDFPPADGYYQTSKTDKDGHYFYGSIESRERFQLDLQSKKIRPQQKRIWYYPDRNGNPLVRVIRIDDGLGGKPRRWQESWNGTEWVKGLNGIKREDIPIYRYREVQEAILLGKDVYIVEGEVCADILWAFGIPATTNIGGSGKWRDSDTQDLFKSKVKSQKSKVDNISDSNLIEELDPWLDDDEIKSQDGQINSVNFINSSTSEEKTNGNSELRTQNSELDTTPHSLLPTPSLNTKFILCPDRDVPGVQHMAMISQSLSNTQWLYAFPQSPLWDINLPDSGGLDIADWIDELRNSYRFTDEQIKTTILNSVEDVRPKLLMSVENLEVQRQFVNNSSNLSAQTYNSPSINSQQPLSTTRQQTFNNNHQQSMSMNNQQQTQNSEGDNTPLLNNETLIGKLQELINVAPQKSVLTTIFNQLGKLIGLTTSEIRRLYNELTKESDLENESPIYQEEINQLLALDSEKFNLDDYLPVEMVKPLEGMAEILGSNSVSQLTALLPVVASLINPQTRLTLIKKSKFTARPIFYSAIVGESGSAKSPTLNIFTEPLVKHMQKRAEVVYQQSLAHYEMANRDKNITEKPPKPKPLEYYVSDFTSESIAEIINNQPNKGFLMNFDELSGLIKQNNAYRGGKGADQEKILSGRDGTGWKVNRKNGDRFNNESSTYSILGAITPDILRQQMGSCQDESGYWARFCYSYLPLKECKFPDDEANIDIYPLLCSLYENLESLPAYHYHLCPEGKGLYREFFKEMENKKMSEPNQAMRAIYSKSKRIAGEIALLLQSLHGAFYFHGDTDAETTNLNVTLEPKFMAMGIKLAYRYIEEIKAIYLKQEGNEENNLSSVYAKIIAMSQRKGWLKARDLKQGDRHFRNLSSVDIRRHFQDLVNLGFGETRGTGKSLEWRFNERQKAKGKGQKDFTTPYSPVSLTDSELETGYLHNSKKGDFQLETHNLQMPSTNPTNYHSVSSIQTQLPQHPNTPTALIPNPSNGVDNVDGRFLNLTQRVNNLETQSSSGIESNQVGQVNTVDNQKQESIQGQTPFNLPLQEKPSFNHTLQEKPLYNHPLQEEKVKPNSTNNATQKSPQSPIPESYNQSSVANQEENGIKVTANSENTVNSEPIINHSLVRQDEDAQVTNNSDSNNISSAQINSELVGDHDLTFSTLLGSNQENIELSNPSDSLDYQLNQEVPEIEIKLNSAANSVEETATNLSNSTDNEMELNQGNLMEFESDSFAIIDNSNQDFSSVNNGSEKVDNSLSSYEQYRGVFARVPVEYAKSGILVRLSERNGYLYGSELGMTFTIKVPLNRVIRLEKE